MSVDLVSNSYPLLRCRACQSVLVESKPSDEELRELYDQLFSEGAYEAHRKEFQGLLRGKIPVSHYRRKMMRKAQQHIGGKSLVEIGGGTGAFASTAKEQGYEYTDFDVSKVAVRCQQELGMKAHWFHPSEIPPIPPASADVLVMWEVIEHVWNLHEYLQTVRAALKPGGVFLFSTPNFARRRYQHSLRRGGGSAPPIHINFFTTESLQNVLQMHGWSRVEFLLNRISREPLRLRPLWDMIRTFVGLEAPQVIFGIAY